MGGEGGSRIEAGGGGGEMLEKETSGRKCVFVWRGAETKVDIHRPFLYRKKRLTRVPTERGAGRAGDVSKCGRKEANGGLRGGKGNNLLQNWAPSRRRSR